VPVLKWATNNEKERLVEMLLQHGSPPEQTRKSLARKAIENGNATIFAILLGANLPILSEQDTSDARNEEDIHGIKFLKELGKGAFGSVWLAKKGSQTVAAKMLQVNKHTYSLNNYRLPRMMI